MALLIEEDTSMRSTSRVIEATACGLMFALLMPAVAGADGEIVAWGNNSYGQCDVPAPNADFVAVSGGYLHSLGLKADGSIVAWGATGSGQCDVPPPNADFVAVAAGMLHSLGLKADGSRSWHGGTTPTANATCRRRARTSWPSRRAGSTVSV